MITVEHTVPLDGLPSDGVSVSPVHMVVGGVSHGGACSPRIVYEGCLPGCSHRTTQSKESSSDRPGCSQSGV